MKQQKTQKKKFFRGHLEIKNTMAEMKKNNDSTGR